MGDSGRGHHDACWVDRCFGQSGGQTVQRMSTTRGRSASVDNLRRIAAALNAYANDNGSYPPSVLKIGSRRHSWRVLILPIWRGYLTVLEDTWHLIHQAHVHWGVPSFIKVCNCCTGHPPPNKAGSILAMSAGESQFSERMADSFRCHWHTHSRPQQYVGDYRPKRNVHELLTCAATVCPPTLTKTTINPTSIMMATAAVTHTSVRDFF